MEGATHPAVGSRIEVFFESEGKYFAGTVKAYDKQRKLHEVHYDDGDEEKVKLSKHTWRAARLAAPSKSKGAGSSKKEPTEVGATGGTAANGAHDEGDEVEEFEQSPPVGTIIDVFWESEGKFFRGRVTEYDAPRNRHKIMYTDGDVERLVLSKERWRVAELQLNESMDIGATGGRMPKVGDVIEVNWPDDDKYYAGTVKRLDKRSGKHNVVYHDGESEELLLKDEVWRWPGSTAGSGTEQPEEKEAKVGDEVEIFWPDDDVFYPGKVAARDDTNGKHTIKYDDGDVEVLNLAKEKWRFANMRKRRRVAPAGASAS